MKSWESIVKQRVALDKSVKSKAATLCEKLNPYLKKVDAKPFIGGSVAKETNLPDSFDVDIFVIFNKKGDLSNLLEKALKNSGFKFKRVHGSRDYFQIKRNDVVFELVPCLNLDLFRQENVIDQSPEHVKYFLSKSNAKLKEQVRITKLFFKANNLYGAESHIKGFSGHSLDLLILSFGSFMSLCKAAALKWKKRVVLDIESQLKNPLMELDKSKLESPLVIVDPIDKYRNSSAAVSKDAFEKFKKLAKAFVDNPSIDFFNEVKEDFNGFIKIKATPMSGKESVAYTKALKALQFFVRKLEDFDFKVLDSKIEYGSVCTLGVKVEGDLNKVKVVKGPPLSMTEHVENFKKEHKDSYEEDGFVKAKVSRKYTSATDLIDDLCKGKYVLSRVRTCKRSE